MKKNKTLSDIDPRSMSVKERMLAYLRLKRIPQVEFTNTIGVSSTYLGAMRKGIPAAKMKIIREKYPDLNPDWVLYGEGEMIQPGHPSAGGSHSMTSSHNMPEVYESLLIPTTAYAGSLQLWSEGVRKEDCQKIVSSFDAPYAINIKGDSMEPLFHDSSTLFIRKIDHKAFIPWGSPMVIDTINGVLVKCVYPEESRRKGDSDYDYSNEYIIAKSMNPAYPPIRIPTDTIFGLYRIVGSLTSYPNL